MRIPAALRRRRGPARTRVNSSVPSGLYYSCLCAGPNEKVPCELDHVTEPGSKRLGHFMRELMPALDGQDTPKQRALNRCALHGDVVRRRNRHDEIAPDNGHVGQTRLTQRMLEIVRMRQPFVPRDGAAECLAQRLASLSRHRNLLP